MQKSCLCGGLMAMKLRTVIYSGKVEIDNVPIYSCQECSHSEVVPDVKPDLTGLIGTLGSRPEKMSFSFNDWNEWADILLEALTACKKPNPTYVERIAQERVNNLLDLLLLAQSLGDEAWSADLQKRLKQISRGTMHT